MHVFLSPSSRTGGARLVVVLLLLWVAPCSLHRRPAKAADEQAGKRILMIAGGPSHGFGAHEHYAGLKVLAETLQQADASLDIHVARSWPESNDRFESADTIVIYSDGGGRHPALPHLELLGQQMQRGCGLVCLHYAVEVPKGEPGDAWLEYLGGYFETHWSVNPHWLAKFTELPEHPITRGVVPFEQQDEWYFHMRFSEQPHAVTPILQAVAPESTMRRPDGPHSGNPHVRKSVAAGQPQTLAWALQRPDGGRAFGFTGGHFHWNWGDANVRRLVANAILWTAGGEVPAGGVDAPSLGVKRLLEDQDFPPPDDFDPDHTARHYRLQNGADDGPSQTDRGAAPQPSDSSARAGDAVPEGAIASDPAASSHARSDRRLLTSVAADDGDDPRAPRHAIAGLQVAEGLQLTLAASEPLVTNLTNLDVDDRGRVWVCDVMNYRGHQGARPEGDRILILEDTSGDGVMDEVKTFYQGTDIDSAMGICVLGNEVIVSGTPTIWRLIDDSGDDRADRKVAMFTDTGQPQHDHSNHSFIFGPDGKLYWNFGNTGRQVNDARGQTVVDIHGRPVVDNGKPFYGGMVFRCDLDGSNFEVLAHNFRNNYETAIDSFGALWQSDNDDDGHRGTRINFIIEHGNYGYREEITGAGWQAPRINAEAEVPLRHWHLNDPGVIPNLLHTGAGSPAGITVYEGRLLPQRFHGQMIHCDPGPNIVRAYPIEPQGAGYTASIEPLVEGTGDPWFRPIDVCTAPDGSLFFTDWYDPGVGGHKQQDTRRGRLYRIAPPETGYQPPRFDYSSIQGLITALGNPALAVRYKAWMELNRRGAEAETELLELYRDSDARLRARALWLLGKIPGRGRHYVELALADDDENIRMTAIRLLRQLDLVPAAVLAGIDQDESPAVRREALIALRYDTSEAMPQLWARLALRYEGDDRWYLEALGVASDIRPSDCYAALKVAVDKRWDRAPLADILWRLRAPEVIEPVLQLIADPATELAATDRYFRALEFHDPDSRTAALQRVFINAGFVTSASSEVEQVRRDAILVRSLERVNERSEEEAPEVRQAVLRHIRRAEGAEWLRLVQRFRPSGMLAQSLQLAVTTSDDSLAVEAVRLLLGEPEGRDLLRHAIVAECEQPGERLAQLAGLLGNRPAIELLAMACEDAETAYRIRAAAVVGLARSPAGAQRLLQLVEAGRLVADTRLLAGGALSRSSDDAIRKAAAELLPMPTTADAQPLPAVDELARQSGDAERGEALFTTKASCANCHVVGDHGKQVGPELTEIGSKLSAEALLTSILDPSAGISHNYETYMALLDSGQVINGLLISQDAASVTLRTAQAIDRTVDREEIVELKKSDKSLMPDDLHQLVDTQGLVDIVHYMLTLKRAD